ncbi:MAG: ribonuclease R [Desulfovibrionaceae bacterium]|jgi:ribonuclease R|nr:ribonuclease R [Desulfovibrionaceae bacterium]
MGRKKTKSKGLDPADILKLFRSTRKPLHRGEILRALKGDRVDKHTLGDTLDALIDQGKVIRLRGGAFGLVEHLKLVTGRLEIQRSGVGFVIPDDQRRTDVFVNPAQFGDGWHGDRVAVALLPGREGRRAEGRVVRVIERGQTRFSARVSRHLQPGHVLCHPTDTRQPFALLVETDPSEVLEIGDILVAEPGEQLERGLWQARLVDRLGDERDVDVQEALVKMGNDVPTDFPPTVLREADNLPEAPSEDDFRDRRDLRELPFVTIDGAKARDFDDAIHVEEKKSGFLLRVAIADVSHYVRPGSRLDREARARGNSYYFPRSVEPMLPERLSNGLCSLNPDVPRLVMVAEIPFDRKGNYGACEFYPAVIRSAARLTYAQVNRAVLLRDADERANLAAHMDHLERAERLARILSEVRRERGSLDFDLPEPEILFNLNGETVDIRPKPRHFGHQIIEEFMIAANEAVARFLTERGFPCMYRIHPDPDPDKLESLFSMLSRTDLAEHVPSGVSAKDLQGLLAAAEGTDLEYLVSRLMLRSMMQATYTPEHQGHFGLASACYCHFTSPIRRYADLVVHRSLKLAILGDTAGAGAGSGLTGLGQLGRELSELERKAMNAEREILKRISILFLQEREGEVFTGVVNGLADFGFWVELSGVMAEGLVRLSTLADDYYGYLPERQEIVGERTGRRFRLGQTVRVRIGDVSMSRLEINLDLLDAGDGRKVVAPSRQDRVRPDRARPDRSRQDRSRSDGQGQGRARSRRSPRSAEDAPSPSKVRQGGKKPGTARGEDEGGRTTGRARRSGPRRKRG